MEDFKEKIKEKIDKKTRSPKGSALASDDIKFVFDNMDNKKIDADMGASPGAIAWLKACQKSDSVKNDFYRNIWRPRVEAKRKENKNIVDDGRPTLDRIEQLFMQMELKKKGK